VLPGRKYTPEDFLRIALRRKWLILLPLVVVSAAAYVFTKGLPDEYRSETTILVVPQRVSQDYVRSSVTNRTEDQVRSLKQQILSRSRLERIIVDLNLQPDQRTPGAMASLVSQMRDGIEVETVPRGDAFTVSYIARDPRTAQEVTARLAKVFIDENVRDREALADATSDFLRVELDDARRRLVDQEKKLQAYRLAHAGELPTQAASNLQGLQNASLQLQALGDAVNRDQDRKVILERQLAELSVPEPIVTPITPSDVTRPETAAALSPADELLQVRASLKVLGARLTAEHPDIRSLKLRASVLEQQIAAAAVAPLPVEGTATPPPVVRTAAEQARERRIEDTRTELAMLNRRIDEQVRHQQKLRQDMAQYQARLEAAPVRESELTELMRDYETLQSSYRTLLAKREDSKIAANLERRQVSEQFRILDAAVVPSQPFRPNRLKLNLLGVALGLFIGIGIVGALEFMDGSLKTEEDIRLVLGLPVIATIPLLSSDRPGQSLVRGRRVRKLTAGAAAVLMALAAVAWRFGR
jgi:polysaccharide chain length determinant protein (PEP-CTERM system associated)